MFSIWIKSDFIMNLIRPQNPIFLRSTHAADHMIDMLINCDVIFLSEKLAFSSLLLNSRKNKVF